MTDDRAPFETTIVVRIYELDGQGHLGGAVYLDYAEHARSQLLAAAGVDLNRMRSAGIGIVRLEERVRYFRELNAGDKVRILTTTTWNGKTVAIDQDFRAGDEPVAHVSGIGGLLDLKQRRLVADPQDVLRTLATQPAILGL
jgi:acyl-CoA thioester hydrolase